MKEFSKYLNKWYGNVHEHTPEKHVVQSEMHDDLVDVYDKAEVVTDEFGVMRSVALLVHPDEADKYWDTYIGKRSIHQGD